MYPRRPGGGSGFQFFGQCGGSCSRTGFDPELNSDFLSTRRQRSRWVAGRKIVMSHLVGVFFEGNRGWGIGEERGNLERIVNKNGMQ